MDMVVSANAGDRAKVSERAERAAAMLESANEYGPSFATTVYREIAQLTSWTRPDVLRRLKAARTDVLSYVDPDYFALGVWTEAGRLASIQKDAAFFRTRDSRKALEKAVSLPGLNEDAKAAATSLLAVQGQGTIQDWTSVSRDVDALQRGLAR